MHGWQRQCATHVLTPDPRPLVKTILQMHLETEAQATIQVETGAGTPPRLVIGDCSSNHRNLRISVLNK